MPDPTPDELPPDDHPIDTLPTEGGSDVVGLKSMTGVVLTYASLGIVLAAVQVLAAQALGEIDVGWVVPVTVAGAFLLAAPLAAWHYFKPRSRLMRTLRRRAPWGTHGIHSDLSRGAELRMEIAPQLQTTPFDPTDPEHLEAAERIRRCRLRDGAALATEGEIPTLRINLDALSELQAPLNDRLEDWLPTLRFLGARDDPRAAWLAAIACTESTRWQRAEKALTLLARDDRWAPLHARVLDWLTERGPRAARTAAALARVDMAGIERLLDGVEADEPPETAAALMQTRWRLRPDPAALARWASQPALLPVLAALPLKETGSDHWRGLVADTPLAVAVVACRTALDMGPPAALPAARALLDRADARARMPDKDVVSAREIEAVGAAIEHLGRAGESEDLRRLGRWSAIPGPVNRRARAEHARLKGVAGVAEAAGGLAVVAAEGAVGGLSRLEVLRGELSTVDAGRARAESSAEES